MSDTLSDNLRKVTESGSAPRIDAQAILRGGRRRRNRTRAALSGGVAVLAIGAVGGAVVVPNALHSGRSDNSASLSGSQAPTYAGHVLPPVLHGPPVGLKEPISVGGENASATVNEQSRNYPQVTLLPGPRGARGAAISLGQVGGGKEPAPICARLQTGAQILVGLTTADPAYGELVSAGHTLDVHASRVAGRYTLLWVNVPSSVGVTEATKLVLGTVDVNTSHVSISSQRLGHPTVMQHVPVRNC